MIDLRPDFLDTLKRLLAEIVLDCEVRIFGSRYNWTATDASDLDLALIGPGKLHWKTLTRLKAALEESSLPYRVDVLDWRAISPEFQKVIEQGYEVIQKPVLAMSSNWNTMTLRDAGVYLIDCEHKTPAAQGNGYPYITIPQIKKGRIDLANVRFISREDFMTWTRKAKPQVHDVVLSRRCNPGETAFVPPNLEFALGQNLVLLRPDGEKLYPPFLRWLVSGPEWWNQIQKYLNAGAIFNSLKCADIPNFELSIPPLSIQRRIADILSALDEKIELNHQTNATLEAIAQAIFKEWFVDFNFPGATGEMQDSELGPIPKQWGVGKLGDIIDNYDSKRVPISSRERENRKGHFPYYGAASIVDWIDDYLFDGVYLLMGEDGTVITNDEKPVLQYVFGKFWVNNHAHVLRGKAAFTTEFIFLLLRNTNIKHIITGAVQPKINQANMNGLPVIIPGNSTLSAFQKTIKPIFENILETEQQSAALATLRDELLPKLMSGEIEV